MKFFIDTANLNEIREAYELGVLNGGCGYLPAERNFIPAESSPDRQRTGEIPVRL